MNKKTFKELTEIDANCIFHSGHHSLSQLYYMVNTYDKQVLTAYIARKWQDKRRISNSYQSSTTYKKIKYCNSRNYGRNGCRCPN